MSEKILVPVLGESIVEATVSKWLKNEGDSVEADEPIVELETDKVNLEVPSPTSGILEKINSKDGSVVEVGATLGSISTNGSITIKNDNQEPKSLEPEVKDTEIQLSEPKIIEKPEIQITENENLDEPLILTNQVEETKKDEILSPAVRKMVSENKIDINKVKGSGKDGRILKGDLIKLMGVNPPPSERKTKYEQEERIKKTRYQWYLSRRFIIYKR